MSFLSYPTYQEVEVPWARRLPTHWTVELARRLFSQERDSSLASDEQLSATQKYGVVPQRHFMDLEDQKVALALSGMDGFKHVMEGDFVISLRSFQGGIEYSAYSGCVSPAYTVLRPRRAVDRAYFRHLLKSQGFVATLQSMTDGLRDGKAVSYQQFGQLRLPVPPLNEQAAIASFLDRETAKIDSLIAEQERLTQLLQEKRRAVISHAVTKGLDPNVPMKPSGVEWLGDVPAHWMVSPLGARYEVQLGKMLDAKKMAGIHLRPYIRVADVQWGQIDVEDLPQMDFDEQDRKKFCLQPGDLLVNEGGSYPGRSAIWRGELEECYYQKALHRLRPHNKGDDSPEFLYFVMSWAAGHGVFVAGGNETTIEHLPAEKLRQYRFGFPALQEQVEISEFLEVELSAFDALASQARLGIGLLQERRAALIAAAVTGQIDVRALVEQEAA